jgi:hypothetical protein
MRRRASTNLKGLFALVIVGSASIAALGAACGGSSETKDAGMDVVTNPDTGVSDTGVVDTGPKDSGCDAPDLLTLMVPDAAFGDGGNQAKCYDCFKQNCMSLLATCNKDCACRTTLAELPGCIAMQGGNLQSAVLACTQGLDTSYLIQLTCALPCGPACGYTPPTDAGGG